MKTLKRLLAIILVLAMVQGLAACSKTTVNDSAQEEQLDVQNKVFQADAEQTSDEKASDKNENLDKKQASIQQKGAIVCSTQTNVDTKPNTQNDAVEQKKNNIIAPNGEYIQGVVLVKVKENFSKDDLGTLAYTSVEPLYDGSKWYSVQLIDVDKTEEAVTYLSGLGTFANVD